MACADGSGRPLEDLLRREWLAVNHIGGYASSTIPGLNTRKYHGLLVAAMAPPVHRMVLLSRVEEVVHCDGWPTPLACNEYPGTFHPAGHESLRAFAHEPFPRWAYQGEGWSLEKSLQLLHDQNTVVLTYTLVGSARPIELELRPLLAMRSIHELRYQWTGQRDAEEKLPGHQRIPPTSRTPEVFFAHDGAFEAKGDWYFNTIYRCEPERGYPGLEDLWCPGMVRWKLSPGRSVHFVCSSDPIYLDRDIAAAELQCAQLDSPLAPSRITDTDHDLLVRAASKFALDLAEESSSALAVMSNFHWGAPSVRDALIALPGVLLITGKHDAAKAMLLRLASHVRDGTLPTEFPEDGSSPIQFDEETALWWVHALWQYVRYSGDEAAAAQVLDVMLRIVRASDGGACVTMQALWYNALSIAQSICQRAGRSATAAELTVLATAAQTAFNRRFWNGRENCCYHSVNGDQIDASIRAGQLLAVGLPFAILAPPRHAAVLERVERDLLTPVGVRSLSPHDPSYHGRHGGSADARDRAARDGSAHPWLLGLYVTACLRVHGRNESSLRHARDVLTGCFTHMRADGLGQICELFDGDPPHSPGGAIACAAAAGELLRCYVEDILGLSPLSQPAKKTELPITVAAKVATKK